MDDVKQLFQTGFNTQPPEGGWTFNQLIDWICTRFNTQPPEGGWFRIKQLFNNIFSFNTQPPEGGWLPANTSAAPQRAVSTHSRPKAAGFALDCTRQKPYRFNTQPPEGGWQGLPQPPATPAGFNTQPPEGGWSPLTAFQLHATRFNTQPPEGGWSTRGKMCWQGCRFQHTAARRRLDCGWPPPFCPSVSTHSRPKAAGSPRPPPS